MQTVRIDLGMRERGRGSGDMGFLTENVRLYAAAVTMHGFCPLVRWIFPVPPSENTVEICTVFLYEEVARDVFGRAFARRLHGPLRGHMRFTSTVELEARLLRMVNRIAAFRTAETIRPGEPSDPEQRSLWGTVAAMLWEGDGAVTNAITIRDALPRYEAADGRVRDHLRAIRRDRT